MLSIVALFSANLAFAGETPESDLEETINEVINILHQQGDHISLEEKRTKILTLLQESFSFDIIIRRALGRNWNALSQEEQDRVTTLISDLLIRAYTRELDNGPKPTIAFSAPDSLSSNKIEIASKVSYKNNLVAVSYRLANIKNQGWQVYDVLIEGISMVSNYRKQFDEHFQTKNGADLISLLEKKLENFDS